MAVADTAVNHTITADGTNDREDALIMLRTGKEWILEQNKDSFYNLT
jgi:hypothetical protein